MHISGWMEKIDLGEEIQEVYLHSFLFRLAVGLVSIFLPLYIIDLGFSVQTVLLFFMVYYGAYIVASWPHAGIASKIGYKRASMLSSPLILCFYLLLRGLEPGSSTVYLVGLVGGLGFNLYWAGMNPEVAESSHSEEREKETGYFFSMPTLASMLSPFVGGLVLAVYSFNALFLLSALLIALSFMPFMLSREHHEGMEMSPKSFFNRKHLDDFLTYFSQGVHSAGEKVLWPLFLALVIKESASIGAAGSMMSLGSAVTSIVLGKHTNEDNRGKILAIGAFLTALSYALMSQVASPLTAFLVSGFSGLTYTAMSIPIYSRAMDRAEKEDYLEYFAFREISLSIGRLTVLASIIAVFLVASINFTAAFLTVSAAVLLMGYFGRKM